MKQTSFNRCLQVGLVLGAMGGFTAHLGAAHAGDLFGLILTGETVGGLFASTTTQAAESRERDRYAVHYHHYYYKVAVVLDKDINTFKQTGEISNILSQVLTKMSDKYPEAQQSEKLEILEKAVLKVKQEHEDKT